MLARRLLAEAVGTAGLLAIVVGSGIMGAKLAGGNGAIALLANALATGFGLFVLISVFAPISGAHFNPLVSIIGLLDGGLDRRTLFAYVVVQLIAAVAGTWLAHAMFGLPLLDVGTQARSGASQWLSEIIATAGLVLAIQGSKKKSVEAVAAIVGAYIAAAYWFTASTSFANPAVTIARSLTSTFAGIAPGDAIGFIAAQLVGAASAYWLSRYLWPRAVEPLPSVTQTDSQRVSSASSLAANERGAIDTVRRSS